MVSRWPAPSAASTTGSTKATSAPEDVDVGRLRLACTGSVAPDSALARRYWALAQATHSAATAG